MRSAKEERKVTIASNGVGFILRTLDLSFRQEILNYNPESTPAIYAAWHGHMYSFMQFSDRKNFNILVSQSNDGEIIARACENWLGFSTVRGSEGRGGTEALREILRKLKLGQNILYTVDGPKGPVYSIKDGLIKIAQLSQKPIIPIGVSSIGLIMKFPSWDAYRMPFLFSKVVSVCGNPIYIPKKISDEELEAYKKQIQLEMFKLEKDADAYLSQKKTKNKT